MHQNPKPETFENSPKPLHLVPQEPSSEQENSTSKTGEKSPDSNRTQFERRALEVWVGEGGRVLAEPPEAGDGAEEKASEAKRKKIDNRALHRWINEGGHLVSKEVQGSEEDESSN